MPPQPSIYRNNKRPAIIQARLFEIAVVSQNNLIVGFSVSSPPIPPAPAPARTPQTPSCHLQTCAARSASNGRGRGIVFTLSPPNNHSWQTSFRIKAKRRFIIDLRKIYFPPKKNNFPTVKSPIIINYPLSIINYNSSSV